jgi:hypothetical protein
MTKLCDDKTLRQLHYLKKTGLQLCNPVFFLVPAGSANRLQDYWHVLPFYYNLIVKNYCSIQRIELAKPSPEVVDTIEPTPPVELKSFTFPPPRAGSAVDK